MEEKSESRTPLFSVRGIWKSFASVTVLRDIDLDVYPGEVLALLGENGAGKSTLMKIMSGIYQEDAGSIVYRGEPVDIDSPRAAQDLGISMIHQELNLLPNRTVAQNIFIGQEPHKAGLFGKLGQVDIRAMNQKAQQVLDRVGAVAFPSELLSELPTAQQQLVEIARTLASDAQVLLMDEPTSSLSEAQSQNLLQLICELSAQGLCIVFTTHRLHEAFEVADRFVVLRDGAMAGAAAASDTTADQVIQWMVGRPVSQRFLKREVGIGETVLEVRGLSGGMVQDVTFSLHKGEILGFGGLVGAGRTETTRLLFGADRTEAGEIIVDGQPVNIQSPVDAVKAGLGLVPEDRKTQSLILNLAVRQNMVLSALRDRLSRNGVIDKRGVEGGIKHYIDRLNIHLRSPEQKIRFLSGGNQQKVVLSRWLMLSPSVLILDEPTRGIDVGAKAEIYQLIGELVEAGIGVILITSEMPELLGLSDRVAVMSEGRIMKTLDRSEATPELVMTYASVGHAEVGRSAIEQAKEQVA
jgi:ribose transport system ATP-binding protein